MRALLAVALLATATPVFAQTPSSTPILEDIARPAPPANQPHQFAWVLEGALEYGGDVVVTILFTDGSEQDILAGQGGTAAFGFDYRPKALPQLGLRTTAGVKFSSNASENSNLSFLRFPIEVVGSYYLPKNFRVGAGLSYHTAIKLDGDNLGPDLSFDPAAGAAVELAWKWLALTYTAIEYTDTNGNAYDASSFGVSFSWLFGKRY